MRLRAFFCVQSMLIIGMNSLIFGMNWHCTAWLAAVINLD